MAVVNAHACTGGLAPVTILGVAGTRPLRRDNVQRTIYSAVLTPPDRSQVAISQRTKDLKKRGENPW